MSSKINLQTCEYARKSSIFQDNQLILVKSLLLGEGAPVCPLGRMRGTPSTFERSRQSGIAFAPQGRRWHGAAMTDEGDHGGAAVIDGPLGTAAPTKSIVTLRRGRCPQRPAVGVCTQRYPPSSGPAGHLPPGRGKALSVLTQPLPTLRRSPHPPQCTHWGTFPQGKANGTSLRQFFPSFYSKRKKYGKLHPCNMLLPPMQPPYGLLLPCTSIG